MKQNRNDTELPRRQVLAGLAALGAGAPVMPVATV